MDTRLALACSLIVFTAACGPAMPAPEVPPFFPPITGTGGSGGGSFPSGGGSGAGTSSGGGSGGGSAVITPPSFGAACTAASSSSCGAGTWCSSAQSTDGSGVCAASCTDGCPTGSACVGLACLPRCSTDADCASGVACVELSGGSFCARAKPSVVSSIVIDPAETSLQGFTAIDLKQDAAGTLHAVYRSGRLPRYGRCASDCTKPSSWRFVSLAGEDASFNLQMGVSMTGKVYLAWEAYTGGTSSQIRFAQCVSGDCATAANWAVVTLASSFTVRVEKGRNLLVDDAGRVHLLAAPFGGDTSYLTCAGNCAQASSWSAVQLAGFRCERASLALGGGRLGAACVGQGSVKVFECLGQNCSTANAWTTTTVSNNVLPFSDVSLSYDFARPKLAFFDATSGPNLWSCDSASCSTASNWSGLRFPPPLNTTFIGGLHLTVTETGDAIFTTAVDDSVRIWRCTAGDACWVPGNEWRSVATVETKAQVAPTLAAVPPACPGNQMGFAQVWDREDPVLVSTDTGVFVLTHTNDFWGCSPDASTYVQNKYRVHLSFAPVE